MSSPLASPHVVLRITVNVISLVAFAAPVRADIFQWEYFDPTDPRQGKRQSTTLAPDGAGVDAVPGAQLYYRDLTRAHLIGAHLRDASAVGVNLTNADLSQSTLTNASFHAATLTDADFTNATVRGATFHKNYYWSVGGGLYGTGIALAQLYSTASYQARDLRGIGLGENNLAGANFTGQNLTNADFGGASLTDADFTDSEIAGVNFDVYFDFWNGFGTGITLAQLYSTANYKKRDLSGVGLTTNDLSGGNFARQNLTASNFWRATLTDADFTDADVRRANFGIYANCSTSWGCDLHGTGLTLEQLYSTASYKSFDLSGVELHHNNLAGGNFVGQNLTNARFHGAPLTDADFADADVRGASLGRARLGIRNYRGGITLAQLYSTASYQARDLSRIDLSTSNLAGGDFAGQNLTNANFYNATLTDATFRQANLANARFDSVTLTDTDFTGAEIRGASFDRDRFTFNGGIPLAQLYSTASYHAHDLRAINLSNNNLIGGNFAGQNLTNANFYNATLADADFTAADARGARFYFLADATTANLILPDGHIDGLDLGSDGLLVVRDNDGSPRDFYGNSGAPMPVPITINRHLSMGSGGTLRMVFEADAWDSTISFAPGIPVTLGGTLELTFAADVNLAAQVGRTFDLFDWTGVAPTGAFAVSTLYDWDLSRLYATGELTLAAVPEPHALLLLGFALTALVQIGRLRLHFS